MPNSCCVSDIEFATHVSFCTMVATKLALNQLCYVLVTTTMIHVYYWSVYDIFVRCIFIRTVHIKEKHVLNIFGLDSWKWL